MRSSVLASPHRNSRKTAGLALAAIGVVYGDIGTSPLYSLKTVFDPAHGLALTPANLVGVVSLIFWGLSVIVSFKYVTLVLRADNRGEGGIMALLALALGAVGGRQKLHRALLLIGVFGAALFYGDSVITPAISVLSAVEGLEVATPALQPYVAPLTIVILVAINPWHAVRFFSDNRGAAFLALGAAKPTACRMRCCTTCRTTRSCTSGSCS